MRRLYLTLPSALIHTSQSIALIGTAILAMAAAPMGAGGSAARTDPAAIPALPPVTAVPTPAGPVMREIGFEQPLRGFDANSPFGLRRLAGEARIRAHKGIDMAAPTGTSVFAAAEGRVLRTGYEADGYGHFIELGHPNGMTTLYGHLSRIDVARGTVITGGSRIGLVGSTGYSTGPHLHFEVRRNGIQVNPSRILGRAFAIRASG